MSNKKLFWVAFFILSCCEFAQVAYSQNILTSTQTIELVGTGLQCHDKNDLDSRNLFKEKLSSNLLPR
ncbi:hypothetical protein [Paraglaciecola arctica]|uniref:Uncharacterized protein n=1 Tax=Paraglaciecola arctica BSs20135 TaxID=493475 RepID=K6Y299_9ALTE|nr:hypothetical protein [Paraglaciecola arctica]GAC18071.1 hypothetical protein GARC_1090 [Paraglaciecola arctica BSs20135]